MIKFVDTHVEEEEVNAKVYFGDDDLHHDGVAKRDEDGNINVDVDIHADCKPEGGMKVKLVLVDENNATYQGLNFVPTNVNPGR
jgi:hypothetical protein